MDEIKIMDVYEHDPLSEYDKLKEINLFNKWFKTDLAKLFATNLTEVHEYHVEITERERVALYISAELDEETLTSLTALNGFYLLRGYHSHSYNGLLLSFLLNETLLPEYRIYRNSILIKNKRH